MSTATDVTIIGAGPYGLSIAAHLRQRNVDFRIVGKPMHSWLANMPQGMLLKSAGFASSLHDPDNSYPLRRYCKEHGLSYADVDFPIPLETFRSYAMAFQERFVPQVEDDSVAALIETTRQGESLADGMAKAGRFPPVLIHMTAVGEETGDLPRMLSRVSDSLDFEVDAAMRRLTSMLEPLIVLSVGGFVGFVVLSILLPIFEANSAVK